MRPLRLKVENLTAFRGEQAPLELAGLDLFAISGPTGSGKSSLLDALVYALYGEVPRVGRNHKELISQGRDRMCVMLDFAHGGEAYRVTRRSYRGSQPAQAILDRLSGPGASAEAVPVENGVSAVNEHVRRLLGLDYDAFTQAVILPQGEFSRFLKAQPKNRNEMLKELLRLQVYERMRAKADAEAKATEQATRMLEQLLAQAYADATPEAVNAVRETLAATIRANTALSKKLEKLEASTATLREKHRRVSALDEARRALAGLEMRALEMRAEEARLQAARRAEAVLPRLDALDAAERQVTAADVALAAAASRRKQAAVVHKDRVAARSLADRHAQRLPALDAQLEELARAVALARPLREAVKRLADARAAVARRENDLETAVREDAAAATRAAAAGKDARRHALQADQSAQRLAEAETALAAADEAYREAAVRDVVGHLRHGLQKGDDCPVCERPLAAAPRAVKGAAAEKVKGEREQAAAALQRARATHEAARADADKASRAQERAAADVLLAVERRGLAEAALAEARTAGEAALAEQARLQDEVEGLDADPERRQAELRAEKQELARALESAARAESEAAASLAGTEAAAGAAQAALDAAREAAELTRAQASDALADAGFASFDAARAARLDRAAQKQLADAVAAWERESHAARGRVAALEAELAGTRVDAAFLGRLQAQLQAAEEELAALRRERDDGLQEESRLRQQLADLAARVEQAEARRRELAEHRDRLSLVRQLALDLKNDRFQSFLLEETFLELVQGASERLLSLSGRYALDFTDGGFHVLDHDNAGERRRAETLSGGETFLASLSLALELSQQVQRAAGAVRLESLFIDEGFGTLDGETLGVIADAIETLPTAGRVVGIITHLGELTERFPVCLKVEKGPEGSRVKLRAA